MSKALTVEPTSGGYQAWRACAQCSRKVPGSLYATAADARAAEVRDATMRAYGHDSACNSRKEPEMSRTTYKTYTKSEAARETFARRHLYMAEGEIKLVEELIQTHGPTLTLQEVLANWEARHKFWAAQVKRLRGMA